MADRKTKYVFITGGVVSSLGKGIASASLGLLLKKRGLSVNILKLDPYLNVDPGTMNPFQHGEVYVLNDGSETDLDLGHYERFLNQSMCSDNNVTSGQIYQAIISRERRGDYLGATVQVIPHVTEEIKSSIKKLSTINGHVDVIISEIGGTVGDIESLPFMEAIRQMGLENGDHDTLFVHLTLVPYIDAAGELKTKPTQHSVKALREIGIQPNILLCRTAKTLDEAIRKKIGLFCSVPSQNVIEAIDAQTIYEVPLKLEQHGFSDLVLKHLDIEAPQPVMTEWEELVSTIKNPSRRIRIAICGKYVYLKDAYKSIIEAFAHAGAENDTRVDLMWVSSEDIKHGGAAKFIGDADGLLIPGGFGERGVEGKIESIRYIRENKIPFLGICLGMHCATIEYARNVCGLKDAHSYEFYRDLKHPVIHLMADQENITELGGTMRLGAYPAVVDKDSFTYQAYGQTEISERHRHRYELNNDYREMLTKSGLKLVGVSPDSKLVEIIEAPDHPWYVAVQFHPELRSHPTKAHPLFRDFVAAAVKYHKQRNENAGVAETKPVA